MLGSRDLVAEHDQVPVAWWQENQDKVVNNGTGAA
jgi:hypothetical protein